MARKSKGRWPLPVYVATFENGEVGRFSFWAEVGKPLDVARGREVCAIGHGIQEMSGYGTEPAKIGTWFVKPSTPRTVVSGYVEYEGEEYADPMTATYTIWPEGEQPTKVKKPNAKDTAAKVLAFVRKGEPIPAELVAALQALAA